MAADLEEKTHLKLNAFEDRKSDPDPKSNYGRHHAFDLFATVARMGESDWQAAKEHLATHRDQSYLVKTVSIRKESFSGRTDSGMLRLQESRSYQDNRARYEPYLADFLKDLTDLFPT